MSAELTATESADYSQPTSNPSFLRRHYGISAEAPSNPRLSIPENLARRTSGNLGVYITKTPDIPMEPSVPVPIPQIQLATVTDDTVAGLLPSLAVRQTTGKRTVKVADYMIIPTPDQYSGVFVAGQ